MAQLIYNYKYWLAETAANYLRDYLQQLLEDSGYTILDFTEHHFVPYGYTALWLLAESHLALHTFPEHNTSYIELSGCNKGMNERFIQKLQQTQIALTPST